MSRKTASNKNKADSEVEVIEENLPTGLEPEKVQETQDQDNQEAIECENTSILLSGKALLRNSIREPNCLQLSDSY
ncbi:hypothetical protein CGI01_22950, partial [Vibrio parahaemolyticus]